MGRVSRTAVVAWSLVALGGCASITGLNDISEQDCAPNCDGGNSDVTTETSSESGSSSGSSGSSSGIDATGSSSGSSGSSSGVSGSSSGSSGSSSGSSGSGSGSSSGGRDAGPDVVADTGPDTSVMDSGCGPTNTLQNCGACGQACAMGGTNGVKSNGAGCTGTTCLYQCQANYLDCNASVGYDPDGCECALMTSPTSPACCGTACPILHNDGMGASDAGVWNPNFYDCLPVGTYTSQLATDACAAWTGGVQNCGTPGECTNQFDAGTGDFVVCGLGPNGWCACWEYQGPNNAEVTLYTGGSSGVPVGSCICPGSTGTGVSTLPYK